MKKEWLVKTLALGIVVLFIGTGVASPVQLKTDNILKNEQYPKMSRIIIYVDDDNTQGPWDGTIEHPYKYIQDGVDNASDGDTVFVFEGTYYEGYVSVKKSINLIGEDKYTTIIDAEGSGDVVHLGGNGINISGFTITNGSKSIKLVNTGIFAHGNDNIIYDNIISNNYFGIDRQWRYYNNTIANNIIENNIIGLSTYLLGNSKIIGNIFKNNDLVGLDLEYESGHFISLNTFKNNPIAIFSFACEDCLITKNNFIRNIRNVITTTRSHKWYRNYWDRPRILPKMLIGWKFGGWIIPPNGFPGIPWFYFWPIFDWHPASIPYNIGG